MTTTILISKSPRGDRAQFVTHTTDPITGKKSSQTRHLVFDRGSNTYVRYSKTHTSVGTEQNIETAVDA